MARRGNPDPTPRRISVPIDSAIWSVEDDGLVHDENPALILAALRPAIEAASP
jgi:hypothetical protein